MRAVLIGLVLLWCPALAGSQCLTAASSAEVWDYNKDVLYWEFAHISDPKHTGFRLFLGTTPGVYTIIRDLPGDQYAVPIAEVLPGPGPHYVMTVAPLYGAEEGGRGPECPFQLSGTELRGGVRSPRVLK
jgi:hypothetical protein